MLEGLDTIDWSSLTHAHGAAMNVPELLRSLLSEDADVWMQADKWCQFSFSGPAGARKN